MRLKKVALEYQNLVGPQEWQKFFSDERIDDSIRELSDFVIKLTTILKDHTNKEIYFRVLEKLAKLVDINQTLSPRPGNLPTSVTYFDKNDLETNFLRFLFATLYNGSDAGYFDLLFSKNPKSKALDYLNIIINDLKNDLSAELFQELVLILSTEINAQKNNFIFDESLDTRFFSLHFNKLSIYILLGIIDKTSDLDFNYIEVFNFKEQYIKRHYENIIIKNFNPRFLYKGSTKDILNEIMKKDEITSLLINSIEKAQELGTIN